MHVINNKVLKKLGRHSLRQRRSPYALQGEKPRFQKAECTGGAS
jgi:hypothetical protein